MAETAKRIIYKRVLFLICKLAVPLARIINRKRCKTIKKKYPGVPVVSYANTSADVKAETDVCCTSANAVKVVESLNVDRVIFLPDQHSSSRLRSKTNKS